MEKSHHLWQKLLINKINFSAVLHKCKQADSVILKRLCSRLVPFRSTPLIHIFCLLLYSIFAAIFSPVTIYYLCKNFTQLIHQESTNWSYKKYFQITHLHLSNNLTALMKNQSMRLNSCWRNSLIRHYVIFTHSFASLITLRLKINGWTSYWRKSINCRGYCLRMLTRERRRCLWEGWAILVTRIVMTKLLLMDRLSLRRYWVNGSQLISKSVSVYIVKRLRVRWQIFSQTFLRKIRRNLTENHARASSWTETNYQLTLIEESKFYCHKSGTFSSHFIINKNCKRT